MATLDMDTAGRRDELLGLVEYFGKNDGRNKKIALNCYKNVPSKFRRNKSIKIRSNLIKMAKLPILWDINRDELQLLKWEDSESSALIIRLRAKLQAHYVPLADGKKLAKWIQEQESIIRFQRRWGLSTWFNFLSRD